MIELAKTGSEVLFIANLATASLVNPEREASQWLELQFARLKTVCENEAVVVLGVGSGFHLCALREEMQRRGLKGRLIALDICAASIEFAQARVSGIEFILVDVTRAVSDVLSGSEFSWIAQAFTLLKHRPTVTRSGASMRTLESWILGRTPESFAAHLKLRPQIAAGLNAARAAKIAETPLLSIRDLSKIWDISSELKADRRVFRVLEELVK